jgi:hypothetical protein
VHDEAEDVELLGPDGFPPGLGRVLNADTRAAWRQIRELLPPGSYLAGGTAVAKVRVDPASAEHIAGATLDYNDGLQGARFHIENPNAQRSCGCGQSFA